MSFKNLGELLLFDISSNGLADLKSRTFYGLKSLRYLILTNNKINRIDMAIFDDLSQLRRLDLTQNRLDSRQANEWVRVSDKMCLNELMFSNNQLNEHLSVRLEDSCIRLNETTGAKSSQVFGVLNRWVWPIFGAVCLLIMSSAFVVFYKCIWQSRYQPTLSNSV